MGDHESPSSLQNPQAPLRGAAAVSPSLASAVAAQARQRIGDLLFSSSFHTLDAKGRFILPSRFRSTIIKEPDGKEIVFLRMPAEQKFIQLLHPEYINEVIYPTVNEYRGLADTLQDVFNPIQTTGSLVTVNVGKNGRITLPKIWRDLVKIDRELIAIGAGKFAILISPVYESELPASVRATIRASDDSGSDKNGSDKKKNR